MSVFHRYNYIFFACLCSVVSCVLLSGAGIRVLEEPHLRGSVGYDI